MWMQNRESKIFSWIFRRMLGIGFLAVGYSEDKSRCF